MNLILCGDLHQAHGNPLLPELVSSLSSDLLSHPTLQRSDSIAIVDTFRQALGDLQVQGQLVLCSRVQTFSELLSDEVEEFTYRYFLALSNER